MPVGPLSGSPGGADVCCSTLFLKISAAQTGRRGEGAGRDLPKESPSKTAPRRGEKLL